MFELQELTQGQRRAIEMLAEDFKSDVGEWLIEHGDRIESIVWAPCNNDEGIIEDSGQYLRNYLKCGDSTPRVLSRPEQHARS
ncbi:MAG: hypothetical protein ACR2LE_06185 [Nocardioidaceae bacterium]